MRLQFATSTLLTATAFIAVWMAGIVTAWRPLVPAQQEYLVQIVLWLGPFWFPFVFAAYALGRRTITASCVLAFAVSEAAVIGVAVWISK